MHDLDDATVSHAPPERSEELEELTSDVKQRILAHLTDTGISRYLSSPNGYLLSKETIRKLHAEQRRARGQRELPFLRKHGRKLLAHFADGAEIAVDRISPELVPVKSPSTMGYLFRIAALLWSVPVSRGFGRRMRYVVIDRHNNRIMGLFALGDPVFNLGVRDRWIGWDVRDREERLVNVMDAYVLGAVPPYSQLIGGKMIASLVGSAEVSDLFEQKYGERQGIISGQVKSARLALATTTSALGRSSLYNRLKIPRTLEYRRLGTTSGYGHFHITEGLFEDLRRILELENHKYASGHQYGDGPNWRFRVVRVGLQRIGLDADMLRHGVKREVYGVPLAENWREYLLGEDAQAILNRPSTEEICRYCIERWMLPRSASRPGYAEWTRLQTWASILENSGLKESDVS